VPHATAAAEDSLWITNVTLVDAANGKVFPSTDVVISGHTIRAVLAAGSVQLEGSRRIDGTGKYLIPGLWDMHVHVADPGYLSQFVANGVLGVRDMGGGLERAANGCESVSLRLLQALRAEVVSGIRVGPDMVLAGPVLGGSGWPTSLPARTPAEAVASVTLLSGQGADFVKVYEEIPLDAYVALAAEANARRLPFAGHVPESVELLRAIQEGQRSIEHLRDAILMCFTDDSEELEGFFLEDGWNDADRKWGRDAHAACPLIFKALREHPAWVTPTLVVERSKVAVEDPDFVQDARRQVLPASVRAGLSEFARRKLAQSEKDRRSEHLWWRTQRLLVGRLGREGVRLLAGTDAACEGGLPGYSLHDELEEMVSAGLSPQQALRAATFEPARYLDRADEGGIAPGMLANLVMLEANPLQDIKNTRKIAAVILRGRWMDRRSLDALGGARNAPPMHRPP
jgi:imidazolonepropionase-like amidohydrolase